MDIPGYEILGPIGTGGTATVYRARQVSLDRIVALKVLSHQLVPDETAQQRFRTEGMAAARLTHANIVGVFDAGEVNGQPFFALEYIGGESVGDLLARKGRLQDDQALAVAESVAHALQYAWDRAAIIHCDIKPDNLLIDRDGTLKIADLGLARILSRREGQAERFVIGTPNYVSPEQARGEPDLDFRTDIYSLGATLYHMLTGVMPFSGAQGAAAMDMHLSEFLADPSIVNPAVTKQAAALIEKLMVRDRARRYANWDEVLVDIETVIHGNMPAQLAQPETSTVRRIQDAPTSRAAPPPPAPEIKVRGGTPLPTAIPTSAIPEAPQRRVQPLLAQPTGQVVAASSAKLDQVFDKHGVGRSMTGLQIVLRVAVFAAALVAGYAFLARQFAAKPPPPPSQPAIIDVGGTPPKDPSAAQSQVRGPEYDPQNTGMIDGKPIVAPPPTNLPPRGIANDWDDPEYQSAVYLYNNSIKAYQQYMLTRSEPAVLKRIEKNLHTAVDTFEKCKPRAPEKIDVQKMIDRANKLIFDVHATMTTSAM
jgi:serine/threonine-protein kinase